MIQDHGIAVDPQPAGVKHLSAIGGVDGHRSRDRQVESQMHLAVDLPAVVEIGPLIREARLDLGIAQRLERSVPKAFGSREAGISQDLLGIPTAEVAVDFDEARNRVVELLGGQRCLEFWRVVEDVRHDPGNESIIDGDVAPAERLREHTGVEGRRGLVAGLVARIDLDGRLQILLGEQREERHFAGGVGTGHPGGRSWVAGERDVPHADAGLDVRRLHAVDHQLASPMVDVVVGRHDRQARGIEPDLDVAGHGLLDVPKAEEHLARGGRNHARGTRADRLEPLPVVSAGDVNPVRALLRHRGTAGRVEGEQRLHRGSLFDGDVQPFRHGAARHRHHDLDVGRAAQQLPGSDDFDPRWGGPTRQVEGAAGHQQQDDHDQKEHTHRSFILPRARGFDEGTAWPLVDAIRRGWLQ